MLLFNLAGNKTRERGGPCHAADGDTDSPQLRLQVTGGANATGVMVIWYRDSYKGYFHHNPFILNR